MNSAEDMAQSLPIKLPGGPAVWIFMTVELVTFAMFLLGHAYGWRSDPTGYSAAQDLVHQGTGALNTAILLVASWGAARAVHANRRQGAGAAASRWWLLTGTTGLMFAGLKLHEYADLFGQGLSLSTHDFWFMYFFLTFLHLLHVLGGVAFAFWAAVRAKGGAFGPSAPLAVEAGATYWHFVDLIWLLLFPTLYLAGGVA
ncbi:MAG: cytochrome c oxidase subunit 3 [Myxococcales bacterium]|nr:cytochrome c oxidase subunit 3 [Myxococcales bacterium]